MLLTSSQKLLTWKRASHPMSTRAAAGWALIVALSSSGCGALVQPVDVLASFYPMEWLALRLAAPNLSVGLLVPEGSEPHDYEPKPSDYARTERARLLVLHGAGLEAFGPA